MGIYNTYHDEQLKVGNLRLHIYKIGDQVDIVDGAYIGRHSIVVIQNGVFIAYIPFQQTYDKFGERYRWEYEFIDDSDGELEGPCEHEPSRIE